jgi:hypothetical protein
VRQASSLQRSLGTLKAILRLPLLDSVVRATPDTIHRSSPDLFLSQKKSRAARMGQLSCPEVLRVGTGVRMRVKPHKPRGRANSSWSWTYTRIATAARHDRKYTRLISNERVPRAKGHHVLSACSHLQQAKAAEPARPSGTPTHGSQHSGQPAP